MRARHVWTDRDFERLIAKLLLVGVSMATVVVLAGGILFLVRHGHEMPEFEEFHGEPAELRTFGGLLAAVRKVEARAVIQLGLGLLVATPVGRVAFSLCVFLYQRDRMYAMITSVVLIVLSVGFLSDLSLP